MEDCLTGCGIGDLDLKPTDHDPYGCFHGCVYAGWSLLAGTGNRLIKRQLYDFLFPCVERTGRLRDHTGHLPQPADLIIKVTRMDVVFLTPAFVGEAAVAAFLDQAHHHSSSVRLGFLFVMVDSTPVIKFGVGFGTGSKN